MHLILVRKGHEFNMSNRRNFYDTQFVLKKTTEKHQMAISRLNAWIKIK